MSDLLKAAQYVIDHTAVRESNFTTGKCSDRQFEVFAKLLADHVLTALPETYKSAFPNKGESTCTLG